MGFIFLDNYLLRDVRAVFTKSYNNPYRGAQHILVYLVSVLRYPSPRLLKKLYRKKYII